MCPTGATPELPPHVGLLRKNELRQILYDLLPPGLRRLRRHLRYAKAFPGAFVSPDSQVSLEARIGRGCVVRESIVDGTVALGDYTRINERGFFGGRAEVNVGKFCLFAGECFVFSTFHNHQAATAYPLLSELCLDEAARELEYLSEPVTIGNDVWVGRGAKVLAGAVIPDGCVVGAGSVVLRGLRLEPYTILAGVPARPIRRRFPDAEVDRLLALRWWDHFDRMSRAEREALVAARPGDPS